MVLFHPDFYVKVKNFYDFHIMFQVNNVSFKVVRILRKRLRAATIPRYHRNRGITSRRNRNLPSKVTAIYFLVIFNLHSNCGNGEKV